MAAELPLILLAGGKGERAGGPKGLLPFRGRPWILAQLEAFARIGRDAVVVLGHGADAYRAVLGSTRIAINPAPELGPFGSIQAGIAAIGEEAAGAFILPVDVPACSAGIWSDLARAVTEEASRAAIPVLEGRGGHPVALGRSLFGEILALPPETSRLDHLLASLPPGAVRRLPVTDPRVRLNLNTPEDWASICNSDST